MTQAEIELLTSTYTAEDNTAIPSKRSPPTGDHPVSTGSNFQSQSATPHAHKCETMDVNVDAAAMPLAPSKGSQDDAMKRNHEVLENDESVTSNNKHQDDFDKNCSKHPMSLLI